MSTSDSLGDRMKGYESVPQQHLYRRTPVIIRIDGKAFHTFTKQFKRWSTTPPTTPFTQVMNDAMIATTQALVSSVQGCVFGYTQSDEISLLLKDWTTYETDAWFGNNVQKIVSVSASIATAAFNHYLLTHESNFQPNTPREMALFDSRAYNLPKEEVTNYFIWRQNDASRNSVQMLGHHHFSQKEMTGKSNNQVHDMLMLERGVNWNDLQTWMKRGSCVVRGEEGQIVIDKEIPIFTTDRSYIERHLQTP